MKTFIKILFLFVIVSAGVAPVKAQTEKQAAKKDAVKTMINAVNYVFKANFANPQRGGTKQLTSDYDLRVTKDTIIAYLPYYGRAYVGTLDPNEGGIKFTSTKFDYKVTEGKKGNWDIVIKPKDTNISKMSSVQQLRLSVSSGGYASLNVTSTNRDPISFTGNIEAGKK
jgi:hypothetical protein